MVGGYCKAGSTEEEEVEAGRGTALRARCRPT